MFHISKSFFLFNSISIVEKKKFLLGRSKEPQKLTVAYDKIL